MTSQILHTIDKVDVILHHAKDAAECIAHTILFHRALGIPTQLIQEVSCQYLKSTFVFFLILEK